jgi:hypothetical protein
VRFTNDRAPKQVDRSMQFGMRAGACSSNSASTNGPNTKSPGWILTRCECKETCRAGHRNQNPEESETKPALRLKRSQSARRPSAPPNQVGTQGLEPRHCTCGDLECEPWRKLKSDSSRKSPRAEGAPADSTPRPEADAHERRSYLYIGTVQGGSTTLRDTSTSAGSRLAVQHNMHL